jgi:hypothetical protein
MVSRVARVNWENVLDLSQAADNVRTEFVGDWHRDPWGWPELGFLVKQEPKLVSDNLNTNGCRRAALIDVPKENCGVRAQQWYSTSSTG